jgi:putative oxidoreductase
VRVRSFLFGGVKANSRLFDLGLLPLRVFAGLALLLAHGLAKVPPSDSFIAGVAQMGFPSPTAFAWAAAASEVVGGALLAIGLLTRPSAFFILCTMLTAGVLRHANDPFAGKEKAFLFAATAFLFLCVGAGRYSADARLVRR